MTDRIDLRVPTPLRAFTERQSNVELRGATVGEAMADLVERYPALRKHLYDDEGRLRSFVNLHLNGQDIRRLQGEQTHLSPGDKMVIVPAIAGGK